MIPLTDKQTISVTLKSGALIALKYLTEMDKQIEYFRLTNLEQAAREKYRAAAAKQIEASGIAYATPEESVEAIETAAYEMLIAERQKDPSLHVEVMRGYVDIFTAGWTGGRFAQYPDNGTPSGVLKIFEMADIYDAIRGNIAELTGMTIDEVKN